MRILFAYFIRIFHIDILKKSEAPLDAVLNSKSPLTSLYSYMRRQILSFALTHQASQRPRYALCEIVGLTLVCISLLLPGCGYMLGEIKPTTMRRVNTISVGTFKNTTLIPRLEAQTADAVAKKFQQDGTYRIETPDRADANLEATIISVKRQPMRVYSSNVMQTSEFELILIVNYVVKDRLTGALLLKGSAEGHIPFFINSDNVNSDLITDQNINYPIAAQRAAEVIVSKVSEGW